MAKIPPTRVPLLVVAIAGAFVILVFGLLGVRSDVLLIVVLIAVGISIAIGMSPLIVRAYRGTSTTPLKSKKKDDDSPRD